LFTPGRAQQGAAHADSGSGGPPKPASELRRGDVVVVAAGEVIRPTASWSRASPRWTSRPSAV